MIKIEPRTVTSQPSFDSDVNGYICSVTSVSYASDKTTETTAVIAPSAHGSVELPPEGSRVLVADTGDHTVVIGRLPAEGDGISRPAADAGERVDGHGASNATIRYASDGSIQIDGDTDVIVNGGTTRPVTDVSTTKDADGHVTDITLTRASNLYV